MDRDPRILRRENLESNERRVSLLRHAYEDLFGTIDDLFEDESAVVSMDQYFESMMFAVHSAAPFMADEDMGNYIAQIATHLSEFVGAERYTIGKTGEISLERWNTRAYRFALHMRRIMAIKDEAYNGKAQAVSNVIHGDRVSAYARRIAKEAGLTQDEVDEVGIAALLHDIGKIGVPEKIITKPGPLTPEERLKVVPHPEKGAHIVSTAGFIPHAKLVLGHHVSYDGTGYPESALRVGHSSDVIYDIIPIADTFDAVAEDRPYRKGLGPEKAMKVLRYNMGTQFNPLLVGLALSRGFLLDEYRRLKKSA